MKIRQVQIQHFRNFKGPRPPVSFVDEATGQVRPLTVLVGSNGSGKTTLFDVMEDLLGFASMLGARSALTEHRPPPKLLQNFLSKGFAALRLEMGNHLPQELKARFNQGQPTLNIAFGRVEEAPEEIRTWTNRMCVLKNGANLDILDDFNQSRST